MPEIHAVLSASGADRWMLCPGSVGATKDLPQSTSVYAEEGTLAHSLGELKVRKLFGVPKPMGRKEYLSSLEKIKSNALYTKEMDSTTDIYVDTIQSVALQFDKQPIVLVEQVVDFSNWVPEGFGTADCVVITPGELHIFDYKHGQGVQVSAVDNTQLKLYALGAIQMLGVFWDGKKVVLHIIQPRIKNISEWEIKKEYLLKWAEETVVPAAKLALSEDAPFFPGEKQCRFCGIRGRCRAQAEKIADFTKHPLYKKPSANLSSSEIGELLKTATGITDWIKQVESVAITELLNNRPVPGYKLVEGRSNRTWGNAEQQEAAFKQMIASGIAEALLFERKPVAPSQLEKLIGVEDYVKYAEPHVIKPKGKPTLVSDNDPRPVFSKAEQDFKEFIKKEK